MSNLGTQLRVGVPAETRLRVAWAAMLVLTMIGALATLLTTQVSADEGEFIHALRTGEVHSVALGHSSDFIPASTIVLTPPNASSNIAVSWVDRFGLRRVAVLDQLGGLRNELESTSSASSTSELDAVGTIAATARTLGAAPPKVVTPGELPLDPLTGLSFLATLVMIGVLLGGRQPRRMTRWGAFWSYLAPFNIGIFYALLRDSPWNQRMNLRPEPPPRVTGTFVDPVTREPVRRYGGGFTFLGLILVLGVVTLVVLAIGWAIPTDLDPVVWTAVDLDGKQLTP